VRTVDVLDVEDPAQSEEQDLGQRRGQLRGGDQHVDAVLALGDHAQALERQRGPVVGGHLDFRADLQPGLTFSGSQQGANTGKWKKRNYWLVGSHIIL